MFFQRGPETTEEKPTEKPVETQVEKKEGNQEELEFNKKNREDFENLMADSSTNLDGYWDKNNPFVKLFLLILLVVIVLGAAYYILRYLGH